MAWCTICGGRRVWVIYMISRVCFVYPWATQGGVERVFLNRLLAFRQAVPHLQADLLFLHDSGGAEPLRSALRRQGMEARILVSPNFPEDASYDLVFCVDCPQVFPMCEQRGFRYVTECHTSYLENRQYLYRLPAACERIIVPSALFGERLRAELSGRVVPDIVILRNFIPWDVEQVQQDFRRPGWMRTPLLFFGRMDRHKNPLMLLDALALLEQRGDRRFFVLLCGSQSPEIDMQEAVERRGLEAQVMMVPQIPFSFTSDWLRLVRDCGGIYVSPSQGESFGLAAAEAMSAGIPVLLSDIAEHRFLVEGCQNDFVFTLDDVSVLVEKIVHIEADYQKYSEMMRRLRERFSSRAFAEDWLAMLEGLER